jgi:hypothetical protein
MKDILKACISWLRKVSLRRKAKIDNNQNEIIEALLDIPGVTVARDHDDILTGHKGRTYWYEIKSEGAVSRKTGQVLQSKKKKSQIKLEGEWTGHYRIVSSLDEILEDMGIL